MAGARSQRYLALPLPTCRVHPVLNAPGLAADEPVQGPNGIQHQVAEFAHHAPPSPLAVVYHQLRRAVHHLAYYHAPAAVVTKSFTEGSSFSPCTSHKRSPATTEGTDSPKDRLLVRAMVK